jgi:hypothetical protein
MAGLAYELGQILEVQGRHDDALAEYYRAKELEPGYKEAQQRITEIERRVASPPPRTPPVAVAEPAPLPELPRPAPVAPTRPEKKQGKKKVSYL